MTKQIGSSVITFAGTDIGFGGGKAEILLPDGPLRIYMQSTVATGGDRTFAKLQDRFDSGNSKSDLNNQLLCMDVEIYDHQTQTSRHLFIGRIATLEGKDSHYTWDDNKSSSEDSMAILLAMLAAGQTYKTGGTDSVANMYIGTGLPIKHYKQYARAYETNIKGSYTVNFKSGPWENVNCTLNIIRCKVYPQVWGIYWNETRDEYGDLITTHNGWTLVLDPGFRTTDVAAFYNGTMPDGYAFSSEFGMCYALSMVRDFLGNKGIIVDEKELDYYLMEKNGYYPCNGQVIDLNTLLQPALKSLAAKLLDDVKRQLQPIWDKIQFSLVGGGGGIALYDYLPIEKKQLIANAAFGNAAGFRKAAQGAILKAKQANG